MDNNLPAHYSLYVLNDVYLNALRNLEIDENGEVVGGEHLQLLQDARDQKVRNYAHMVLILETELDAVKKEKDRIATIQSRIKSKINWLESNLKVIVKPGEKFERISWRKSKSLEIMNIDSIPEDCLIHEIKPDKDEITRRIKQGAEFDGCQLVEKLNIQIK